jgi:hypothetical protein
LKNVRVSSTSVQERSEIYKKLCGRVQPHKRLWKAIFLWRGSVYAKKTFDYYIAPSGIIGRQGPLPEPWKETGTFLSPTPILEAIIEKSENMRTIEEKLSVPTGAWDQTMYLIRIWDPASSRLRLPTHESAGANSKFRQGGLTAGGLPEGFISLVDFRTTMIMSSGDEVTYNNVSVCEVVPGKKPPDPTNLGPMAGTLFQLDKLGYPANL